MGKTYSHTIALLKENIQFNKDSIELCNYKIKELIHCKILNSIDKIEEIERKKLVVLEKVDDYQNILEILKDVTVMDEKYFEKHGFKRDTRPSSEIFKERSVKMTNKNQEIIKRNEQYLEQKSLEKALRSARGSLEAEGISIENAIIEEMENRFKKRNTERLTDIKQVNERTDLLKKEIEQSVRNTYKK